MRLTGEQSYALLEKHDCYVAEGCDKCVPCRFQACAPPLRHDIPASTTHHYRLAE